MEEEGCRQELVHTSRKTTNTCTQRIGCPSEGTLVQDLGIQNLQCHRRASLARTVILLCFGLLPCLQRYLCDTSCFSSKIRCVTSFTLSLSLSRCDSQCAAAESIYQVATLTTQLVISLFLCRLLLQVGLRHDWQNQ